MLLCSGCSLWLTARLGMPPRGLATLWVGKRPVCAAGLFGPSSHLEHRELSCSGRAHCVRWVAQLHQKTSLVLCRWVTQASSTGLPEAFTCPVTLDGPGRLGARSLHSPVSLDRPGRLDFEARWLLRPLSLESLTLLGSPSPESLTPWLCFHPSSLRLLLGVTSSCHITGVPPHTSRQDHRRNRPQPTLQEPSHWNRGHFDRPVTHQRKELWSNRGVLGGL